MSSMVAVAEEAMRNLPDLRSRFGESIRLVSGPIATPDELRALTEGASGLLVTLQSIRADHIEALPDSVRVIGRAGVGLDTIDVEAARARGIAVIYQPNYATNEVADHAAAMTLAVTRKLRSADELVRAGWGKASDLGSIRSLSVSTAGVVGTGRIGRAFIERIRPFVAEVVAYDPAQPVEVPGVTRVDTLPELLRRSHLVSLHVPLTEETRHMIDAAAIEELPDGAVLINVSRGGLLDEAAVAAALHSGKLGGAGVDVFQDEPPAEDSALRDAPNALLSPHVAWYSDQSGDRLASWSAADIESFLADGRIAHGVVA